MKIWKYAVTIKDGDTLYDCGPFDVPDELVEQYIKYDRPLRMDFHDTKIISHMFRTEAEYNAFCCGFSFGKRYEDELDKMTSLSLESYLKEIDNE